MPSGQLKRKSIQSVVLEKVGPDLEISIAEGPCCCISNRSEYLGGEPSEYKSEFIFDTACKCSLLSQMQLWRLLLPLQLITS